MKQRLLNWLVCPRCQGSLQLAVEKEADTEIEEGTLACKTCAVAYPIKRGIPRFVPSDDYAASFGRQWNRYKLLQLDSQNNTKFSRERFYSITEWIPTAFPGKLVLDAGCGAGRFSEVVLEDGAEVVSVDLSSAIDACQQNLRGHKGLHCVQASLFELPFRPGSFDYVYCIGVIQHTPDPQRAVLGLTKQVAPGGSIGLWIYELSWKSFIGTAGFRYLLRPWTKRLSLERLEVFSADLEKLCYPLNNWSRRRGRLGKVVMRMLPAASAHIQDVPLEDEEFREWVRLDTFDMYSPAHDHPQRFSTIQKWLETSGFKVDPRHPHGAISITGKKL